LIFPYIVFENL